jgi:hypothetical protein
MNQCNFMYVPVQQMPLLIQLNASEICIIMIMKRSCQLGEIACCVLNLLMTTINDLKQMFYVQHRPTGYAREQD